MTKKTSVAFLDWDSCFRTNSPFRFDTRTTAHNNNEHWMNYLFMSIQLILTGNLSTIITIKDHTISAMKMHFDLKIGLLNQMHLRINGNHFIRFFFFLSLKICCWRRSILNRNRANYCSMQVNWNESVLTLCCHQKRLPIVTNYTPNRINILAEKCYWTNADGVKFDPHKWTVLTGILC